MKKLINSKTIPYVVVVSGILGMLLRLWIIGKGEDAFGLYPSHPVGWALLWTLTAALVVMVVIATRPLKETGNYSDNFPRSLPGMLGCLTAAMGTILTGSWQLQGNGVTPLTGLDTAVAMGGIIAGGVLILLGIFRFLGKKPGFLLHGFLCLYFAVRVFHHCRVWSNEPQIGTVVLPFLASLTLMLACYQRTCFDVGLGNRRHSLLWSFMSVYLCMLAVLSFEEILFYAPCALWLMTDLCSLRPMRKKKSEAVQPETPSAPEAPEEAKNPETMSMDELEQWLNKD